MSGGAAATREAVAAVDVHDMLDGADSDHGFSTSGDSDAELDADDGSDIANRDSGDDEPDPAGDGKRARGRPSHVQVDEERFRARCNGDPPPANKELMAEFGCSYRHVQYLKRKWGCGQNKAETTARHTELVHSVTRDSLHTRWVCEDKGGLVLHRMPVKDAVKALAAELGVGVDCLRDRMKEVNFDPKHPYPLAHVETMVRTILETHTSGQLGASFVEAKLRRNFNAVVRVSLIRKALMNVDAHNYLRRRKPTKKTPAQYTVKGARSLYHIDAHEKLAKLWGEIILSVCTRPPVVNACIDMSCVDCSGIWVHGCIDGYSRFLVYLEARLDKKSETVRAIFVKKCAFHGWASRVRGDRGKVHMSIYSYVHTYICMYLNIQRVCMYIYSHIRIHLQPALPFILGINDTHLYMYITLCGVSCLLVVHVCVGQENMGVFVEMIDRYYDPNRPSTLTRGSAISVCVYPIIVCALLSLTADPPDCAPPPPLLHVATIMV